MPWLTEDQCRRTMSAFGQKRTSERSELSRCRGMAVGLNEWLGRSGSCCWSPDQPIAHVNHAEG